MLTPDMTNTEFSLLPQSFLCLGSTVSVFGVSRVGLSLLVLDFACLGFSLPLHDYLRLGPPMSIFGRSCSGPTLLVFDHSLFGSVASMRVHTCLGLTSPIVGMARLYFPMSLLGIAEFDSPLSLKNWVVVHHLNRPCQFQTTATLASHLLCKASQELTLQSLSWIPCTQLSHCLYVASLNQDPQHLHSAGWSSTPCCLF